ncbi:MAG: hypothetical protein EOP37_28710 [Rubrivivax sp.]|nr:MAG: hypothetical protein EOP37_28710 [Rubrivivax sp.]
MPIIRRVIALLVLWGCVWAFQEARKGSFGMLGAVVAIVAVVLGIVALAGAIFNLKVYEIKKTAWEDSGFENSVLDQRSGRALGVFMAFLFGGPMVVIAVRGLFRGVIPALWSAPDLVASRSPVLFVLACALWLGLGMAFFVLIIKGTWHAKFGGEKDQVAEQPRRRR